VRLRELPVRRALLVQDKEALKKKVAQVPATAGERSVA
jgi:hypothetical protein